MEKDKVTHINTDGSFVTEETIRTTPEDGIVSERTLRPAAAPGETFGKARMGYSTTKSRSTNNPKVTKPFVYTCCGIFFLIGIGLFFTPFKIMGVFFLGMAIAGFLISKKQIDEVAESLKAQGQDVTINSPEELKEVVSEVSGQMKEDFAEVAQQTFTEQNTKSFSKTFLPIYYVLVLAVSALLWFVVHPLLSITVFVLLSVGGILYFFLLKLITKLSQGKH